MELGARDVASYSFLKASLPQPASAATKTISLRPESRISVEQLLWSLAGVAAATSSDVDRIKQAKASLPAIFDDAENSTSLRDWYHIFADVHINEGLRQCLNLATALAFLLQCGRKKIDVALSDLDFVWSLLHGALLSDAIEFKVFRSALGYHSIPVSSHSQADGSINELFRLHVFVPDDHEKRTPISNIHTHQAFGQGWILTGLGTDNVYEIETAEDNTATHTEFSIAWNKDNATVDNQGGLTQQGASSTMTKTRHSVRAIRGAPRVHGRGTNYTLPAGKYHALDVGADELHCTLFLFDSSRGFQLESPALGPLHGPNTTLPREKPRTSATNLAKTVDCLRKWEDSFTEAKGHVRNAKWEEGLQALRTALRLCEFLDEEDYAPLEHARRYKWAVQGEIGHAYRMIGRNEEARDILVSAVEFIPKNLQRIELFCELAVVYRHLNDLKASRKCTAEAYAMTKELLQTPMAQEAGIRLQLEKEMCRAVGDWGMVNYQIFLQTQDSELLDRAMRQMNERITIARSIKASKDLERLNAKQREELMEYCSQRESIALARLSLFYAEIDDIPKAITVSKQALDILLEAQSDPTKVAFSRYFYGRALLRAGKKEEAKVQFDGPPNTCTPTIALCNEASDEHRSYIKEMVEAGADMELRDEQGYSALECAIYREDEVTQRLVEGGLRRKFHNEAKQALLDAFPNPSDQQRDEIHDEVEKRLDEVRHEAYIRKGYRRLVQDTIRPVLLEAQSVHDLAQVRNGYTVALRDVNKGETLFDSLRVVSYLDFLKSGKIPKFDDGYTKILVPDTGGSDADEFVIFFSYRWLGAWDPVKKSASPDDENNTQYKRMVDALADFKEAHPRIDPQKMAIWIDYACVDQKDGLFKAAGIVSLPLNLAQCNAMISLIDETYLDRAWCAVEVNMIQTLRKSYREVCGGFSFRYSARLAPA